MKTVQSFTQGKVVVLHEDDSVHQAARAMKDRRIGCVLVSDHRSHIVGIVTDRDIVNRSVADAEGSGLKAISQKPLREIMTRNPVVVQEGANLKEVISKMEEYGVRRIPVIHFQTTTSMGGGSQHCIGVVTLDDLIASKALAVDRLSRIVRSQLKRKSIISKLSLESQRERDVFFDRLNLKLSPKLEFDRGELEQLTVLVLGAIVRRLHPTGGLRFVSELPNFIQPALLGLPAGPDESVDLGWLTRETCRLFEVDDPTAYAVLVRFGSLLEEWCDEKGLGHVKSQLPKDLRALFSAVRLEQRRAA